jgi:hyperosmotically inducible protein
MRPGFLQNLVLGSVVSAGVAMAGSAVPQTDATVAQKAVHEIRMYPRYSIFDNINVRVQDGNLELLGQVSQPYKKTDLQRIMDRVPGVRSVTNQLEVLPLSSFDDRLRMQVASAIYRDPVLSRFGMGALPSIHVIVDNGHVTLEGVVSTEMERNVAGIRASSAGLGFGPVVNHLVVENPSKKKNS